MDFTWLLEEIHKSVNDSSLQRAFEIKVSALRFDFSDKKLIK